MSAYALMRRAHAAHQLYAVYKTKYPFALLFRSGRL